MIILAREHLRQIADAAEAAYPRECCGLLSGRARANGDIEVVRVHPSANLGKSPERFEIDPRLWVDLSRALGKGPTRVVGLYHSHPDRPAQPSAADLEAAWGEELVWVIASVAGAGASDPGPAASRAQAVHVTAHILDHGGRQFRPVELRTDDWHPYPARERPEPPRDGSA